MATNPALDLELTPLGGSARPLRDWLTTFHMASVIVDPYTNESAWVLDAATRIMNTFADSAVRVNFVVTADATDASAFLGPLTRQFMVFCDPARSFVRSLGLTELPAFVFLLSDGTVPATAQGWDPPAWRTVADEIARVTAWSTPDIPGPADPAAYHGTPALT